jgi:hypothetical protein
VALFFKKWLRDLASEQTEKYGVQHIVPKRELGNHSPYHGVELLKVLER